MPIDKSTYARQKAMVELIHDTFHEEKDHLRGVVELVAHNDLLEIVNRNEETPAFENHRDLADFLFIGYYLTTRLLSMLTGKTMCEVYVDQLEELTRGQN